MKKKVLNLYAGIGGNRKLWTDCEVTAVEINKKVANVYHKNFPNDDLIIEDAHSFLLNNFEYFDFVWSSPPCQSHSRMVKATRHKIKRYPKMELYQEILLLQNFFDGKWVVENVVPYYNPLLPAKKIGRHLFWSNFYIPDFDVKKVDNFIQGDSPKEIETMKKRLGIFFDENIYLNGNHSPGQILRNAVLPEIGLHIYNQAMGILSAENTEQLKLAI